MMFLRKYGKSGPQMFEEVWELLRKYTFVVNHRSKQRGLPRKGQLEVMGAICSRFLLAMQTEILHDYKVAIATEAGLSCGVTPNPTAHASSVSSLRGAGSGGCATPATDREEAERPIRWNSRGPDPLGLRLPKKSRKVRGGRAGAARAIDARIQIARALEFE